jgi:hypothetical protein
MYITIITVRRHIAIGELYFQIFEKNLSKHIYGYNSNEKFCFLPEEISWYPYTYSQQEKDEILESISNYYMLYIKHQLEQPSWISSDNRKAYWTIVKNILEIFKTGTKLNLDIYINLREDPLP